MSIQLSTRRCFRTVLSVSVSLSVKERTHQKDRSVRIVKRRINNASRGLCAAYLDCIYSRNDDESRHRLPREYGCRKRQSLCASEQVDKCSSLLSGEAGSKSARHNLAGGGNEVRMRDKRERVLFMRMRRVKRGPAGREGERDRGRIRRLCRVDGHLTVMRTRSRLSHNSANFCVYSLRTVSISFSILD